MEAARKVIEGRNPNAFKPKIASGGAAAVSAHRSGCNCKKSHCVKRYCECFQVPLLKSSS